MKPTNTKSYCYPLIDKDEVRAQVPKMLETGIIRSSILTRSFAVCVVLKKLDPSGFHKLEIEPKDILKNRFLFKSGHFEFARMSFSLKNAPSTFQSVMEKNIVGIQNEK